MNSHDIIIRPVLSEKSFEGIHENLEKRLPGKRYVFIVAPNANKTEIKKAVEEVFGVKVAKVNTVNYDGKVKRRGASVGKRADYKKAYVQLTADSKSIEYFESLT